MPAVLDAAERKKQEDALLRKAESSLALLRKMAETADVDRVETAAQALTELLKAREFPSQWTGEFRTMIKAVQRDVCQLSVDRLITEAERKGHQGDEKGRNELLSLAKKRFIMAVRNGADDEFRHGVERRVQAALMTSADGVDERTKKASARKLLEHDVGATPPKGMGERRRAIRYSDPVLTVELGGMHFKTINWSIRGLLIEGYKGELALSAGDHVKLTIQCAELPPRPVTRQLAGVARVDKDRQALALNFPDISTVILDLAHAMKDAGIRPEPER
jgi:hypothetical protein